jgi:hypothetical protein
LNYYGHCDFMGAGWACHYYVQNVQCVLPRHMKNLNLDS